MEGRRAAAIALSLAAVLVIAGVVAFAFTPKKPKVDEYWGVGTSSDGRVEITLEGSYWTTEGAFGFDFGILNPNHQYLVVNLTIGNVASFNVTIGASFWTKVSDGRKDLTNTVLLNRATLLNQFPMPPTVLRPGRSLRGWMAFFFPLEGPSEGYRFVELMYVDSVSSGPIESEPQIHVTQR